MVGQVSVAYVKRKRRVAIFLAFALGVFGAHKFYLRQYSLGFVYIALSFIFGISYILAVVDAIRYIKMGYQRFGNEVLQAKLVDEVLQNTPESNGLKKLWSKLGIIDTEYAVKLLVDVFGFLIILVMCVVNWEELVFLYFSFETSITIGLITSVQFINTLLLGYLFWFLYKYFCSKIFDFDYHSRIKVRYILVIMLGISFCLFLLIGANKEQLSNADAKAIEFLVGKGFYEKALSEISYKDEFKDKALLNRAKMGIAEKLVVKGVTAYNNKNYQKANILFLKAKDTFGEVKIPADIEASLMEKIEWQQLRKEEVVDPHLLLLGTWKHDDSDYGTSYYYFNDRGFTIRGKNDNGKWVDDVWTYRIIKKHLSESGDADGIEILAEAIVNGYVFRNYWDIRYSIRDVIVVNQYIVDNNFNKKLIHENKRMFFLSVDRWPVKLPQKQ